MSRQRPAQDRLRGDRRTDLELRLYRAQGQPATAGARAWRRGALGHATPRRKRHPLQASLAACREHNHGETGPHGFQGGCDLVQFRSLGATGVVIGPGTLAVAHKPDEFVPIDEFIAASLIYRDVALQMLKNG